MPETRTDLMNTRNWLYRRRLLIENQRIPLVGTQLHWDKSPKSDTLLEPHADTAVGDRLIVLGSSYSSAMLAIGAGESANWTNIGTVAGGSMTAYTRIATLDGDDDYTIDGRADENFANILQCQMITLRGYEGLTATKLESSSDQSGSSTEFRKEGIPATDSSAPEVTIACYGKFVTSVDATEPTFTDPDGFTSLSHWTDRFGNDFFWGGLSYKMTEEGEATVDESLTYDPSKTSAWRAETFRFVWT